MEMTVYDHAPMLSNLFNEEMCQKIEDKSHAVIMRDSDCRLIIQGSDQLHVLLALSIIEDIAARFETNVPSETSGHSSSRMLNAVLEQAYSNDNEVKDAFDWSTMPEEVKRSVLVSLFDNDVSETAVIDLESITGEHEMVPVAVVADVGSSLNSNNDDGGDGDDIKDIFQNETVIKTPGSATVAASVSASDTLSVAVANVAVDLPHNFDFSDPTVQPLIKLALSKGYSREEIEKVLSRTKQWKESEFLRILHTNRRILSSASQLPSVTAQSSRFADNSVPFVVCSVTGPRDTHRAGNSSEERGNVEDVSRNDSYVDVHEVNTQMSDAADESAILLISDNEMETGDNVDIGREHLQSVLLAEQSPLPSNGALTNEPAKTNTSSGASLISRNTRKKLKRKQNRQKLFADKMAQQKHQSAVVKSTRNDAINELDPISLIPSSSSALVDASSEVFVVSDDSDSDGIEGPQNLTGMKPVVSHEAQHQCQKEARSRSPQTFPASNSSCQSASTGSSRQLDHPARVSVPGSVLPTAAGPQEPLSRHGSLRYIVIDGSNVAMSHGNGKVFSCHGIKLVIDYFKQRGHSKVVAMVPQWRCRAPTLDRPISDQHLLEELKEQGTLTFTPSRRVGYRNINCYDDRFA